jgi:serine/threonine protein kinase
MYLSQGTELNNRYVIESLLGHGGFGITYAAFDTVLSVRVAVKEYLPRQLATRGEGQSRVSVFTGEARQQYEYGLHKFLEEAQSVARFAHHPNVVSARDYFEANGTAYMVMEYVEGVTLKEYLAKKGGRIAFEEAKGFIMPVMDALREVHQGGMLHRDISPDNIYITTTAQVKILDNSSGYIPPSTGGPTIGSLENYLYQAYGWPVRTDIHGTCPSPDVRATQLFYNGIAFCICRRGENYCVYWIDIPN